MKLSKPVEMFEEIRSGVRAESKEIPMPVKNDAMEAMARMDGQSRSLLSIVFSDQFTLIIGGDGKRYVCSIDGPEIIVNVISGQDFESAESLVVGGQEVDYPSAYVLGKSQVKQIVELIFNNSELEGNFSLEITHK